MKVNPALLLAMLLAGVAGCDTPVDDEEPIDGYTEWYRLDTWGPLPGHGESYRSIFVNDVGRSYRGGLYPVGTVLVKEIRTLVDRDQPGDLRYLAVMRRISDSRSADDAYGWLFTSLAEPGAQEYASERCWSRCHVQAPIAGAWFDYGADADADPDE